MASALSSLTSKLSQRLGMGSDNGEELINILKATAFKGQNNTAPTDAQLMALLIVADQYGLNPWTKEIYAYPDKNNGIVPVVGVDGWSRIINNHPQFDGVEFNYGPAISLKNGKGTHEWIECVIHRKDRSRPTVVREFFAEVVRDTYGPWQTHPNRMHRHKSYIQCGRIAFGYTGIYDQDEAERIIEKDMGDADVLPSSGSSGDFMPKAKPAALPADIPHEKVPETVPAKEAQPVDQQPERKTDAPVAQQKAVAPTEGVPTLTEGMIRVARTHIEQYGADEAEVLKKFGVSNLGQIPSAKVNELLLFIKKGA